jgi:hypothetical protein
MHSSTNRFRSRLPRTDPPPVYTNDGGTGLLEACKCRFPSPAYEVSCDARQTVWVKSADGQSFGLAPWLLRRHTMEELLDRTADKLGLKRARR